MRESRLARRPERVTFVFNCMIVSKARLGNRGYRNDWLMIPESPTIIPASFNLAAPNLYINRELSQLEFNRRVLDESQNPRHPLLERLKFLTIFASNLDEFFMVRVSGLKQQVAVGVTDTPPDGLSPREQLAAIHRQVTRLYGVHMNDWRRIHQELAAHDVHILDYQEIKPGRQRKLRQYFEKDIFPVLTPLAFDPGHPFPHISNLSLNLAVVIRDPDTKQTHFARVKIPASLPRLAPLQQYAPDELLPPSEHRFVWLEQVIAANLDRLFLGMEIVAAYPFRITRNTDMDIQEEEADDLLLTIEEGLRQRHFGQVVRLEVEESTPDNVRQFLMEKLKVSAFDVYTINGPLGLHDLWELHRLERPDLKDEPYHPTLPPPLRTNESIFKILRRQDVLLHRPYDSFKPIIDFVREAAEDRDVLAIKMTLYRVGPNPPIVHALMRARENGKQVAVMVELKARFDEESNIEWARALENAGVHVAYGLIGLKTHAKMCLVVRREQDGLQRYLHLSTGNYNATTARIYTDIDLLTSNDALGADASDVFNYLTGYSKQKEFRRFLVAPRLVRQRLLELIEEEIALGPAGRMIFKFNALVDPEMIQALYRASQAGVKVDLIIRGICCLRPGLEGISENIQVTSIIGRFLEHSRIYYFHHGGQQRLYVGSADLMPRNLDRRVEVLFPIENPTLQNEILNHILAIYQQDTLQAYRLDSNGQYHHLREQLVNDQEPFGSQTWFLTNRTTLQHAAPAANNRRIG